MIKTDDEVNKMYEEMERARHRFNYLVNRIPKMMVKGACTCQKIYDARMVYLNLRAEIREANREIRENNDNDGIY